MTKSRSLPPPTSLYSTVKTDEVITEAFVRSTAGASGKASVEVFASVADELVFQGNFTVYRMHTDESQQQEGVEDHADSR